MHLPRHIAVVMDGNGRWAEQRGLPRLAGHMEGRKATGRCVRSCLDYGIEALSLYAFSVENWRRPMAEVAGVLELIQQTLAEELDELCESGVRVVTSGRLGELPESLQQVLSRAQEQTAGNTEMSVNLLVDYSGRAEIVDAARAFAVEVEAGRAQAADLDEARFASHLYAPGLPEPDLLIRPGGEKRISNFLLWEIAYAELVFLDVLWPDFDRPHLLEAIREFSSRQRRFGAVPQSDSQQ